jgi:hypothetical protein
MVCADLRISRLILAYMTMANTLIPQRQRYMNCSLKSYISEKILPYGKDFKHVPLYPKVKLDDQTKEKLL